MKKTVQPLVLHQLLHHEEALKAAQFEDVGMGGHVPVGRLEPGPAWRHAVERQVADIVARLAGTRQRGLEIILVAIVNDHDIGLCRHTASIA